ncbi:hypothetical protein DVH24_018973 [Malus domestica]|uniref:Uncharacterized protein n=1 Tax=Malus domestica TaxID=3750 RepID=A0A498KYB9_MALDO|nr:hypothetical protein DVH24_018973 [Malus domestica]
MRVEFVKRADSFVLTYKTPLDTRSAQRERASGSRSQPRKARSFFPIQACVQVIFYILQRGFVPHHRLLPSSFFAQDCPRAPYVGRTKKWGDLQWHLVNCDTWMNIHLREVICTSKVRVVSLILLSLVDLNCYITMLRRISLNFCWNTVRMEIVLENA